VFRAARSPLVFVGEGKTRRRVEGEPDKFTDLRDSYFVLIERLEKHDETMTRFDALRVMARAHWGVEAEKPFSEILLSYLDVGMAARMMIAVVEEPPQNTRDLRERWRTAAWAAVDGTDEISRRVNDAVDQVEALCRKHLR